MERSPQQTPDEVVIVIVGTEPTISDTVPNSTASQALWGGRAIQFGTVTELVFHCIKNFDWAVTPLSDPQKWRFTMISMAFKQRKHHQSTYMYKEGLDPALNRRNWPVGSLVLSDLGCGGAVDSIFWSFLQCCCTMFLCFGLSKAFCCCSWDAGSIIMLWMWHLRSKPHQNETKSLPAPPLH